MADGNLELSETLRLLKEKGNPPPADQLRRLWEIPEKVPDDFRVPPDARLALASGSDDKRKLVTEVWKELGGKGIIITKSVEEELIKNYLRQNYKVKSEVLDNRGAPDVNRVRDIAELKARLTSDEVLKQHGATHAMGLDVDVAVWPDEEPMGIPKSNEELRTNLEHMQGKIIAVNIGGAMRERGKPTNSTERVHINIPIGRFDVDRYIQEYGEKAIGHVAGGLDFSDPHIFDYLGDGTITVDRELHFSPRFAPETQLFRTVGVYGDKRPELLGLMSDYFKGAPKEMVRWVIYQGFKGENNIY